MLKKLFKTLITGLLIIAMAIGLVSLFVVASVQQAEKSAAQVERGY